MYPKPYKQQGCKNYYFKYTDPVTRKQRGRTTGQTTKKLAEIEIKNFIDALNSFNVNSVLSYLPLKEYLKPWTNGKTNPRYERYSFEEKQYGTRQVKRVAAMLEQHVITHPISDLEIYRITRGAAVDFRAYLLKNRLQGHPQTVNVIISVLKAVFNEGIFRGELTSNPFSGIGNIKTKTKPREILSLDEFRQLFRPTVFPSELAYRIFLFAAATGMRTSEVLALHWEQLSGNMLTVDRAWVSPKKLGPPKWGKTRTIPLSNLALSALPEQECELMFHRYSNRLGNTWWKKNFQAAMERSGIEKHITPHCLRHTLNSQLLLAGISPFIIQYYLGWSRSSDLTKTQEGYTHVLEEHLQPVARAIDTLYTPEREIIPFEILKNA